MRVALCADAAGLGALKTRQVRCYDEPATCPSSRPYGGDANCAAVATGFPDRVRNSAQICLPGVQFIEQLLHPVLKLSDRIDAVLLIEVFDRPKADPVLPGGELLLHHRSMGRLINGHQDIRSLQVSFRDLFGAARLAGSTVTPRFCRALIASGAIGPMLPLLGSTFSPAESTCRAPVAWLISISCWSSACEKRLRK